MSLGANAPESKPNCFKSRPVAGPVARPGRTAPFAAFMSAEQPHADSRRMEGDCRAEHSDEEGFLRGDQAYASS